MWEFDIEFSYKGKKYKVHVQQILITEQIEKYKISASKGVGMIITSDRPLVEYKTMKGEWKRKKPSWKADRIPSDYDAYNIMLHYLKQAVNDFYHGPNRSYDRKA